MTGVALIELLGLASHLDTAAFISMQLGVANMNQGVRQADTYADAEFKDKTLKITPYNKDDAGLFLPWLDSQQAQNAQAQIALGSFTREIGKNSTLSWVATGPFTGCHAVAYRSGDDYTFCHLVTGGGSQPVNSQKQGINSARPTSVEAASTQISVPANMGNAQGFAFWMRASDGKWRQRTIWIGAGPKPWPIVGREAAVPIGG